jgi:hypothetical protein
MPATASAQKQKKIVYEDAFNRCEKFIDQEKAVSPTARPTSAQERRVTQPV